MFGFVFVLFLLNSWCWIICTKWMENNCIKQTPCDLIAKFFQFSEIFDKTERKREWMYLNHLLKTKFILSFRIQLYPRAIESAAIYIYHAQCTPCTYFIWQMYNKRKYKWKTNKPRTRGKNSLSQPCVWVCKCVHDLLAFVILLLLFFVVFIIILLPVRCLYIQIHSVFIILVKWCTRCVTYTPHWKGDRIHDFFSLFFHSKAFAMQVLPLCRVLHLSDAHSLFLCCCFLCSYFA